MNTHTVLTWRERQAGNRILALLDVDGGSLVTQQRRVWLPESAAARGGWRGSSHLGRPVLWWVCCWSVSLGFPVFWFCFLFSPLPTQSCELFILLSKFVCTHLERILFSTVLEVDSLIFASSHAKVSTYLILPPHDQEIKTLVFISISRWGSNFSNLFWRWRRDIGGDFSLQKVGRKV